jgi:hypothetical protein
MKVHSGMSVSGFNFSSKPMVNLFINGIIKSRIRTVRNYYSLRTVCPSCAAAVRRSERNTLIALLAIGGFALLFVLVFVFIPH